MAYVSKVAIPVIGSQAGVSILCEAMLDMGWELWDDQDLEAGTNDYANGYKVFRSNMEDSSEPYGYTKIAYGSASSDPNYIDIWNYYYWDKTAHTGLGQCYGGTSYNSTSHRIPTSASSGYWIWVYGSKNTVVVMVKINTTYTTKKWGFLETKIDNPQTTITAGITTGTDVTVTVADASFFKVGEKYQLFSDTGEGRDTITISAVDTGAGTITISSVPRDYSSGTRIGRYISTFWEHLWYKSFVNDPFSVGTNTNNNNSATLNVIGTDLTFSDPEVTTSKNLLLPVYFYDTTDNHLHGIKTEDIFVSPLTSLSTEDLLFDSIKFSGLTTVSSGISTIKTAQKTEYSWGSNLLQNGDFSDSGDFFKDWFTVDRRANAQWYYSETEGVGGTACIKTGEPYNGSWEIGIDLDVSAHSIDIDEGTTKINFSFDSKGDLDSGTSYTGARVEFYDSLKYIGVNKLGEYDTGQVFTDGTFITTSNNTELVPVGTKRVRIVLYCSNPNDYTYFWFDNVYFNLDNGGDISGELIPDPTFSNIYYHKFANWDSEGSSLRACYHKLARFGECNIGNTSLSGDRGLKSGRFFGDPGDVDFSLLQVVDVSAHSTEIDAGTQYISVGYYDMATQVQGYYGVYFSLDIEFRDGSDVAISTEAEAITKDKPPLHWRKRESILSVPVGTRKIYYKISVDNDTAGWLTCLDKAWLKLGTATSVDVFEVDELVDKHLFIYAGTGYGQTRKIQSNTTDTITVYTDWDTQPDSSTVFHIADNVYRDMGAWTVGHLVVKESI